MDDKFTYVTIKADNDQRENICNIFDKIAKAFAGTDDFFEVLAGCGDVIVRESFGPGELGTTIIDQVYKFPASCLTSEFADALTSQGAVVQDTEPEGYTEQIEQFRESRQELRQ